MRNFAIAVLGAGAWGTALAVLLARNGQTVRLWDHDTKRLDTPYDDDIISDVDIKSFTPDRVKVEFENLEKNIGYVHLPRD